MSRNAIKSDSQTSKMADRSEMARNVIESDFRTFKMADGGHFVKKLKNYRIDMKGPEMRSKVKFRTSKMVAGSHFVKHLKNHRNEYTITNHHPLQKNISIARWICTPPPPALHTHTQSIAPIPPPCPRKYIVLICCQSPRLIPDLFYR